MLRKLEPQLRAQVRAADLIGVEATIRRIQALFINDRDHHRVLRAKNWYYQCLLEHGKAEDAKAGLEAVQQRSKVGTRVHLEATALLAVCYLRLQMIDRAKASLRVVVKRLNAIGSETRRRQFQERLLMRIDDELILSQLIGRNEGTLEPEEMQREAVRWHQTKSPEQIYALIGNLLPPSTPFLIDDVRRFATLMLPWADQKALPPPRDAIPKETVGRKTEAALKRIGWRTLCAEDSSIYKMWKERVPKVFSEGYFAVALTTTLAQWRIGIPQLGVGILAIAMRYGCQEFCDTFRPDGLMIPRDEKG